MIRWPWFARREVEVTLSVRKSSWRDWGLTPRAALFWEAFLDGNRTLARALVRDITDDDRQGFPDYVWPGVRAFQSKAVRDDPYVWIDPFEGR